MRPLGFVCPRLHTCVFSLVPLILIYVFPIFVQFHQAAATYEDLLTHEDHNHHRLLKFAEDVDYGDDGGIYEPDFIGADRSIIGRSPTDNQALVNNVPGQLNIEQGASQFWSFSSLALSGLKSPQTTGLPSAFPDQVIYAAPASSDGATLYISLNTCLQPSPQSPQSPSTNGSTEQLKLYVSTSDNQQPNSDDNDYAVPVDGGFAWLNISSVKTDVYIGVVAPKLQGFTGVYNYELTASIDGFYASYYDASELYFVDSDATSALLYTSNTTNNDSSTPVYKAWMSRNPPPFTLFVQNHNNPSLLGLQRSYCALKNLAQVSMLDVDTTMTSLNNGQPQQQFHAKALNGTSRYYAILAVDGNSTNSGSGVVGGGGIVWDTVDNITTKQDGNCVLVFNLPFCSSVAYAAPGNPSSNNISISNATSLGLAYDQYASLAWTNFSHSLAQVACNTTSSAQYSLARNCTDCANAYKEWLCAVVIPRCEDFSNPAPYLQPRAIGYPFINETYGMTLKKDPTLSSENQSKTYFNSSRNPMIDSYIKPGPYKEVLPCEDICYELVRSCPSFMGFACPLAGHGLNYSYGKPTNLSSNPPTCNSAKTGISGAAVLKVLGPLAFFMVLCSTLAVMAT